MTKIYHDKKLKITAEPVSFYPLKRNIFEKWKNLEEFISADIYNWFCLRLDSHYRAVRYELHDCHRKLVAEFSCRP